MSRCSALSRTMAAFLIHLLYIATFSQSLTRSRGNQAPVSCEVCDVTDPACVKGGARTVCDVTQQYCLTEVTDTLAGERTVGRKCVGITECEQKFAVTEERLFCYEVEMGNLRADVTCSFCCQGDLCNQGPDLIPPAQFLYNGDLYVTGPSTPSVSLGKTSVTTASVTDSSPSDLSTVPINMCEVCGATDPDCLHGGTPTSCDEDYSFCMTTVHDNFPNKMTVSRSCVNESVCYQKWFMETSWRHYCYDIDQGELYFPVDCNFCCVGDLCNAGPTLVPSPETLYQPTASGTPPLSEGSSTTPNGLTVPSQSYPLGSTKDGFTESTPSSPQGFSTDATRSGPPNSSTAGRTSLSISNPQGSSTDYFTGPSPSNAASSSDGLTSPTLTSPEGSRMTPVGPGSSPEGSTVTYVTQKTTVSITEKYSICEVCDESDPECFTSGTPTHCDLEESYCMTTVHDNYPSNMTVSRSCVNESMCYQKWYMETSWRHYCYDIDQGELYFSVDCSFCCVGDLCNSGALVPNPDTLYRPPELTNATDLSTPSVTEDTPTPTVLTTPHIALCDVCTRDDLGCVRGGRPTLCDPDRPYCQVTVYEDSRFTQYAERSCADLNTCMKDWINHTSGRPYCLEVDKGPLFYPNFCSFCCVGDQCNNGSLVPSSETFYYPAVTSSTPQPTSTAHPDNTGTTSDETQTTLDVTEASTESITIHYPICDTCSSDDPNCMTRGQPTTCNLDTPFCMTSVTEDMTSTQTARRLCVNETVCQVEWLQKTSTKYYCYRVDQGPLYFANTCSFCCRGDLCNSGTLVPDTHKLYALPPTTRPTATDVVSTTP
ncbi:mucin-2-like isoform X4 [Haliotis asinina]|uniref:mucin-2-like isoform X4 n=1 Tax=Haliotis asinina TaxID=109174 RepID=UPI0035320E72